jgi:hypothetical protein
MSDLVKRLQQIADLYPPGWVRDTAVEAITDIERLRALLIERDGGTHDPDCRSNYGRKCNCGHDAVVATGGER